MSRARNGWKQRIRRLWKWIDGRERARGRESEKGEMGRGRKAEREGLEEKGSDHEREERTRGRREERE
jgi:hypothetical protein